MSEIKREKLWILTILVHVKTGAKMQLADKYEFLELQNDQFRYKDVTSFSKQNTNSQKNCWWNDISILVSIKILILYRRSYTHIISVSCLPIMEAQTGIPRIQVN